MENQGAAAPFPIIIIPNDQDTAPLREANGERNYERAKTWLMNRHFGEEQQEKLRGAITSMVQGSNESPAQFYARVAHAVGRAGFAAGTEAAHITQTWKNGLHREIRNHIAGMLRMTAAQNIEVAN